MRLIADENFPQAAIDALRSEGHDVLSIRLDAPGSRDSPVLARAVSDGRILLTFDKDFGELAFKAGLPAACDVILFRISAPSPTHVARITVAALASREDWAGHFAVVENTRIRVRTLPQ
ncbi:MAG: DUF5615 family PIN-like protein [Chloroflexi bacterium]|nr:DUF5615 family PIN-like protein [Chloroflexota bacterium]